MKSGRIWFIVIALAALIVCEPAGAQRPSFTLAVLRQDGVLIPFATFDGQWRNHWPEPRPAFEVPIALDDVDRSWWPDQRPQVQWALWLPDGRQQPLTALGPAWIRAQCLANIGLRTDYRHPDLVAPPDAAPYPKVGLAIAATEGLNPIVEPVAILDEDSDDWRRLRPLVTRALDAAESQAIKRAGFKHPYSVRERMGTPVSLEALYRAPAATPGTFVYLMEFARRHLEKDPGKMQDPPCDLITYASAWVFWGTTGPERPTVHAVVTDCYRWNATFALPLGVLRGADRRPVWVIQGSGWGHEAYAILDGEVSSRTESLWYTSGGSCR
jgi:hypothetical protein